MAFHRRWVELLRDQPGNPSGAEVRTFEAGRIVATAAAEVPEVDWLQHVGGLRAGDDEWVFELATWYAELGLLPRWEVPTEAEDDLIHALLAVDARPTGALALLGGPVRPEPTTAGGITVRAVEPGSPDAARLAEVVLAGHEVDDDVGADHVAAVAAWASEPGWHAFLALADGEPVGGAVLVVAEGLGYLANAATVPAARGRGVQQALVAARSRAAADAGCDVVGAVVGPDGPSARNLVRAGLGVVGACTYWTGS